MARALPVPKLVIMQYDETWTHDMGTWAQGNFFDDVHSQLTFFKRTRFSNFPPPPHSPVHFFFHLVLLFVLLFIFLLVCLASHSLGSTHCSLYQNLCQYLVIQFINVIKTRL